MSSAFDALGDRPFLWDHNTNLGKHYTQNRIRPSETGGLHLWEHIARSSRTADICFVPRISQIGAGNRGVFRGFGLRKSGPLVVQEVTGYLFGGMSCNSKPTVLNIVWIHSHDVAAAEDRLARPRCRQR